MNPVFFYLINLVMLTRLFTQFRDRAISTRKSVAKMVIEFLGVFLLQFNWWWGLLIILILLMNLLVHKAEQRSNNLNHVRMMSFVLYILIFGTLGAPVFNLEFNTGLLQFLSGFSRYQIIAVNLLGIDWHFFLITFFGLMLSLNESNFFIRYFFEVLNLFPRSKSLKTGERIDLKEYNRGRVIGFLERTLIYFFVFNSQYAAIGFIVAAKGVTRFRELEERSFAEYFLIGTLLSVILSGAIALIVKMLLQY
jgi:hypothetical protein